MLGTAITLSSSMFYYKPADTEAVSLAIQEGVMTWQFSSSYDVQMSMNAISYFKLPRGGKT